MSPSQSQQLKQRALDLEAQADDSTKSEAEIGKVALEAAMLHFELAKNLNEPPDPTRGNLPDPNSHINRALSLMKRARAMCAHGKCQWGPSEKKLQKEIDVLYYKSLESQPMIGNQTGLTEDYERLMRIKGRGLDESALGGRNMKNVTVKVAEGSSSGKKKASSKWSITKKSSTPWSVTKVAQPVPPPTAPSVAPTGQEEQQPTADPQTGKPIGGMILMDPKGKSMGNFPTLLDAQRKAQEIFQTNPQLLTLNIVGPDGQVVKPVTRNK